MAKKRIRVYLYNRDTRREFPVFCTMVQSTAATACYNLNNQGVLIEGLEARYVFEDIEEQE